VTNAYTGGISLSVLLGLDEKRSKLATAIAGAVGIVIALIGALAAAGFYALFQSFLSLLCAIIPPLAGIMIADYWILGQGKKENFKVRRGVYGPGPRRISSWRRRRVHHGGTFATYFPKLVASVPFCMHPSLWAGQRHRRFPIAYVIIAPRLLRETRRSGTCEGVDSLRQLV
jgi:cytosine permease